MPRTHKSGNACTTFEQVFKLKIITCIINCINHTYMHACTNRHNTCKSFQSKEKNITIITTFKQLSLPNDIIS